MSVCSVTVVIPAYNAARFVAETIQSVLDQTIRPARMIVVDDGSTDATADIVRTFGSSVELLTLRNSGQPAVARNAGVALASTEWLAFLDADDLWLPHKLERQLGVAEGSSAAAIYSDRYNIGEKGDLPEVQSVIQALHSGDLFESLLTIGNYITMSSMLVRTEAFRRVGGFEVSRSLPVAEDWDLWIRLSEDATIEAVAEPLVKYRFHSHMTSGDPRVMQRARWEVVRRALARPKGASLGALTRRRIVAATARTNGWDAGRRGDWKVALTELLRAIVTCPWHGPAYKELARLALGRL